MFSSVHDSITPHGANLFTLKDKIRYSQWFPQGGQQPHPIGQRHLLPPFYFLGGVGGEGGSLPQLSPTYFFTVLSHCGHCGARDVVPLILHLGISLMSNSLVPAPVVTAALQGPGFLSMWTGLAHL